MTLAAPNYDQIDFVAMPVTRPRQSHINMSTEFLSIIETAESYTNQVQRRTSTLAVEQSVLTPNTGVSEL